MLKLGIILAQQMRRLVFTTQNSLILNKVANRITKRIKIKNISYTKNLVILDCLN